MFFVKLKNIYIKIEKMLFYKSFLCYNVSSDFRTVVFFLCDLA